MRNVILSRKKQILELESWEDLGRGGKKSRKRKDKLHKGTQKRD